MERSYENRFEDRIEGDQDLSLRFEERASGSLVVFLEGERDEIRIDLKAKAYSYVKVFVCNRLDHKARLTVSSTVEDDARVDFGMLDVQDEPLELKIDGSLEREGATMEVHTAQLCLRDCPKKGEISLVSQVAHTYGMMHNFAVCFDAGSYEMAASGRIVKGAPGSESHQETRVLTMGKNHKALVIPILYIDENDVKASHALTIGQPDAEQLYYIQSRGLNTRQAMGLLSVGYFKPVLALVEDEALRDALSQETERRVGLYEN